MSKEHKKETGKIVSVPLTIGELMYIYDRLQKEWSMLDEEEREQADGLRLLLETFDHYRNLVIKNADNMGAVSLLSAEHKAWLDQLDGAMRNTRKERSIPLPVMPEIDPRQLEIPLEKTIDRVAEVEGGLPVGDPQDSEDGDG